MLSKLKPMGRLFTLIFCFIPLIAICVEQIQKKYVMKENMLADYAKERESFTINQIHFILDRGNELLSRTDIVNSLVKGGSALFPHTCITQCGDQIAAIVHASLLACQKSGKNQILLIGVLHSLTDALKTAREKEINGIDILNDPCRGIFGPDLPNKELLCKEFSLDNFIFLLEHAAKRIGIKTPKVIIRYPNLIYGQPELIPGIEELQLLAKESIVIATSNLCHHGLAYGLSLDKALPLTKKGYEFAYRQINKNLRLLSGNDLLAYRQYCLETLSDSVEVGQILNFLLGPLNGYIRDLRLVDVSDLFEETPQPSWVAVALVELRSKMFDETQ